MKLLIFNIILLLNIDNIFTMKNYRVQFKNVCGQPQRYGRIVGGSVADLGEFPWITRIGTMHGGKPDFFCGGSLITDRHILTAEHCFYDIVKEKEVDALVVSLGSHTTNNKKSCVGNVCSDDPTIYKVQKLITYKFDESTSKQDISILQLPNPVKFTRWVSPVCLPDHISPTSLIGESVMVIGFGLINSRKRKLAKALQKITISIKPISDCNIYEEPPGLGQICAGGGEKDSCDGDSGGPLFKLISEKGGPRYTLLGIVSFGATKCGKNFPAVYTDVNYYLNWIDNQLDTTEKAKKRKLRDGQ